MTVGAAANTPVSFANDPAAIEIVARMKQICHKADPLSILPDVHPERIPRHIAFIMDGNGRWAQERGFPRIFGHRNGAAAVRTTVEECGRLGVECVTLYSFSMENWRRPQLEIDALMAMCLMYVEGEREAFMRERIRLKVLGQREGLPQEVIDAIDRTEEATANLGGPTLCIALNYGARAEIIAATQKIAARARLGEIDPASIDEEMISNNLTTAGVPDPDLLVRTAGEQRISNFLLWQLSYAELYFTPVYWPDFTIPELHKAIRSYAARSRRFGGLEVGTAAS